MDRYVITFSKNKNVSQASSLSVPGTSTAVAEFAEHNYAEETVEEEINSNSSDEPINVPAESLTLKKKRKMYSINPQLSGGEFTFLDKSKPYPFCKICQKKLAGGKFHMIRHMSNVSHKKNELAARNTAQLNKMFSNAEKETKLQLIRQTELKYCCYICEHNLSFSIMNSLPEFCKSIYVDSDLAKDIKLKRKKTTQLIVGHLGPSFKQEIVKDLRNTNFSIIIDETTDISTKKCLVFVVRYWKHESVYDRYLDLIEPEGGTAEAIFDVLKKFLDVNNIPYKNVLGFASDNVNVMMGRLQGVQARIKRELQPNVFVQGCSCHSLHLCSSAAAKKLPSTVEQFVRDIYAYFAYSSKRTLELKEYQIFANEKPHKMLHPSQTRWLSLQAVVDRVLQHWNSLLLFFQNEVLGENLPSAKQILNALRNPVYKLYLLFLSYVLKLINKLNLELQSSQSKVPLMLNKITSVYKTFIKCFIKKEVIDKSKNLNNINVSLPHNYLPIENIYLGAKVDAMLKQEDITYTYNHQEVTNYKLRCLAFYIEICKQIKDRFDFNDKTLLFASYFVPEIACGGNVLSIAEFINFFPHIDVDIEAANVEWQLLGETTFAADTKEDINIFWRSVQQKKNILGEPMFPNLMIIVKIIMSLPHSSAAAERVFSSLNLLKTKTRNSLAVKTCSAVLSVKDKMLMFKGGSVEWKPEKALLEYKMDSIENVQYEEIDL